MKSLRDYYDSYSARQARVGTNERHLSIVRSLRRFGLRPGQRVLEIGCGIGTVTALMAKELDGRGSLVAVDLSPRSIEIARERLASFGNVELIAADAVALDLRRQFDVIVLPDVIEHIPLDLHRELFARVRAWLAEDGWVLIHIPNPFFLEWCQRHRPDLLQLIDQPVFLETLIANTRPHGLHVHFVETYSIWVDGGDYQTILLRPAVKDEGFRIRPDPVSLRERAARVWRFLRRRGHPEPPASR